MVEWIKVGGSGRLTDLVGLGALTSLVPRQVLDEAIELPGCREEQVRKLPDGPKLFFTCPEWKAFVSGLKTGDFEIAEGLTRRDGSGPVSSIRPEAAA